MIERILDLPSHLRERLASALETGILEATPTAAALHPVLGQSDLAPSVLPVLEEFHRLGLTRIAAAAWIRSLSAASMRRPEADLVWTGPSVPGLRARDTRRVYESLLGSATRCLWVSTYAFFDGPRAFAVLARRMEEIPGLEVFLLLNLQRKRGDTTAADHLIRRFADRFWTSDWPGTARPRVYFDPRALDLDSPGGVLHAKATVADHEAVFVTSANLTEAALDRNIELGLLLRDRALALGIESHFRTLIGAQLLQPLPHS